MAHSFPEIMTIGETAQYLRISSSSLYKLAQEGRIPCQKVGRHWRFHRDTILQWVAGQKNMVAATPPRSESPATRNHVQS